MPKSFSSAPRLQGRKRRRRRGDRSESALDILNRLLAAPMSISLGGEPRQVCVIEAIMLQLIQKATTGNLRAHRALEKYQAYARTRAEASLALIFEESDYTTALATFTSEKSDG
ncbi:DUF5681 domain-containing protein [Methylocapsa palsarum]|uniref:DUF5681 domain-containing protein n=1 Tax=Methylocapsa palsarum TaxID=1612308 RepID=A0A1I4CVQ7_9HYPH|nr:DUF5681 domain-containing protein [Methylocapsa palsarum]SFK85424.1 hypothetical protein SAMN05444581_13022 [Methylocapsa palsarum]